MRLAHSTMRPGRVLSVLEDGKIKAEAPGLFSREDLESLPSIMPFFIFGHKNSFSAPKEGDEVWILSQGDNPQDLRWMRKDDFAEPDADLLSDPECEILLNRESGYGSVLVYFTEANGLTLMNNDSTIRIRQDGSILIDANAPHRVIDVSADGISIGSQGSSAHSAAYGDEVEKFANLIYQTLSVVQQAASGNVYTTNISAALQPQLPLIKAQIPNLTSNNVTLD